MIPLLVLSILCLAGSVYAEEATKVMLLNVTHEHSQDFVLTPKAKVFVGEVSCDSKPCRARIEVLGIKGTQYEPLWVLMLYKGTQDIDVSPVFTEMFDVYRISVTSLTGKHARARVHVVY